MSKNNGSTTAEAPARDAGGFVKKTVTIPASLVEFVDDQVSGPRYGGNFSAYVRGLITDHLEKHQHEGEDKT